MSATCDQAMAAVGGSISGSLAAVDCLAQDMTAQAFARLSSGPFLTVLSGVLVVYVAWFGFSLLTGRGSLGITSLTPRALTIGMVLTFATSWIAYQTVVWNVVAGGPDEIAGWILGKGGSATQNFAQTIDVVFAAIAERATGTGEEGPQSVFSPGGLLWLGATLFLLGTVGVLVTCRIAMAVLVMLGPIFVVFALFPGTRGLFVGWLKGLVMLALAPLFAVLSGGMLLEMSVPILNGLGAPGDLNPRAAMAFFLVGAVHVALMVLVMKVAGQMVAGWTVFGMATDKSASGGFDTARAAPRNPVREVAAAASGGAAAAAGTGAGTTSGTSGQRRINLSGVAAAAPANDGGRSAGAGQVAGASTSGGRRDIHIHPAGNPSPPGKTAAPSRASGIGTRFRSVPQRVSEKVK